MGTADVQAIQQALSKRLAKKAKLDQQIADLQRALIVLQEDEAEESGNVLVAPPRLAATGPQPSAGSGSGQGATQAGPPGGRWP